MAPILKTPRFQYFDPDSDSDTDPQSLPTIAPPRRTMEFYDTHIAPQPSRPKSTMNKSSSAPNGAPYLSVGLTDSPVGSQPVQQQHTGEVSSQTSLPSSQGSVNSSNHGVNSSNQPSTSTSASNRPREYSPDLTAFGASIARKNPKSASQSQRSYIKPATPNAFSQYNHQPRPQPQHPLYSQTQRGMPGYQPRQPLSTAPWPSWVTQNQPFPGLAQSSKIKQRDPAFSSFQHKPPPLNPQNPEEEVEVFDINNDGVTAADYERFQGDADAHMRELLSGAIGDGEDANEQAADADEVVEGFAKNVRLMPHQIRGVKWMRGRESGRKYGGILADDMGLGKTVQTLARIVEGVATAAEKRAGYKGGTLIVAPLAVMEQWASECRSKTAPGRLRVTTHHGPSRTKSGKTLENFDVVITTFQTLASEYKVYQDTLPKAKGDGAQSEDELDSDEELLVKKVKRKTKKQATSAIYSVKWLRVVIDEAQNIKNKNTNAAKASVGLQAKYRWCLTGTPIQNSVEELFSLFKFLRAKPLDDWNIFRERIVAPMKNNQTGIAMKRLHVILKAIMLRRTKDATIDGKRILNLPKRTVEVVQCAFDAEEREFYGALEKQTALSLNKFVKTGSVMQNYTSVLTMLLRLRQACDHPSLCAKALSVDADAIDNKAAQTNGEVDQADELADLLGGLQVKKDKVCEMCFVVLQDRTQVHCDECKEIVHKAELKAAVDTIDLPPSSAKIRKLLDLIMSIEERSGRKEKTIVFSQFTSFLDLIGPFLRDRGIEFVRYDGSMKNDLRQESLERIKSDPAIRLILISFKAGSTGLNLTCCNNVILMDLWWNPALEEQAFDRAHRLGQKLDVNIFKLTIDATVEDRILALQESKRELARAALSGDTLKNVMKLSLADIMALFRPHHDDV